MQIGPTSPEASWPNNNKLSAVFVPPAASEKNKKFVFFSILSDAFQNSYFGDSYSLLSFSLGYIRDVSRMRSNSKLTRFAYAILLDSLSLSLSERSYWIFTAHLGKCFEIFYLLLSCARCYWTIDARLQPDDAGPVHESHWAVTKQSVIGQGDPINQRGGRRALRVSSIMTL